MVSLPGLEEYKDCLEEWVFLEEDVDRIFEDLLSNFWWCSLDREVVDLRVLRGGDNCFVSVRFSSFRVWHYLAFPFPLPLLLLSSALPAVASILD